VPTSAPTALPQPTKAIPTVAPTAIPQPTKAIATAVPAVAAAAISQASTFGNGTFIVGSDIAPGTYRNTQGSGCYWARLSGFGGTLGEILANDNTVNPAIVTISPTDKGFESVRCGQWTSNLSPVTANQASSFGAGTYIVGVDITAGQWKSSGQSGCYWARLRGFGGGFRDIIANNNIDNPTIVQIGAGDKGFFNTRCGTWTLMSATSAGVSGTACPSANVCITSPSSGLTAMSGDIVEFTGSATGSNFGRYQFLAGNGSSWGHIVDFKTPISNGKLMDFHTETIPPGTYTIELQVIDKSGNVMPEKAQIVLTIQ